MKTTIPTPKFAINKRMVSPVEVDMWNIKGKYADGMWHELIHACIKDWAAKNRFEGKGTLWSNVMSSANFENYTNAYYVAAFGMTGFMKQLESTLSGHISGQVRRSGEMQVERGSWRPYLHLEHGKIWIISDDTEWVELGGSVIISKRLVANLIGGLAMTNYNRIKFLIGETSHAPRSLRSAVAARLCFVADLYQWRAKKVRYDTLFTLPCFSATAKSGLF